MLTRTLSVAAAAMALSIAGAASAAPAKIVAKNAKGHATRVSVNGKEYAVCNATKKDGCINPREANLGWGNRPLKNWPGKPASQRN